MACKIKKKKKTRKNWNDGFQAFYLLELKPQKLILVTFSHLFTYLAVPCLSFWHMGSFIAGCILLVAAGGI